MSPQKNERNSVMRITTPIFLVFLLGLMLSSCSQDSSRIDRTDYPDILNIKNVPDSTSDWGAFCFSDLGAWTGFALPDSPEYYGQFIGPFSMRTGKWIARDLIGFRIYNEAKGEISFSNCRAHEINYFPGLLKQNYIFDSFQITLSLFYISEESTLISAAIKNNTNDDLKLYTGWQGSIIDSLSYLSKKENTVIINDSMDNYKGFLTVNSDITLKNSQAFETTTDQLITIPARKSVKQSITFTYRNKLKNYTYSFLNEKEHFQKNQARWNTYLEKIFSPNTKWLKQKKYKRLAVKALETLVLNWRSAADDLKHDGLFPSSSVWYFNGFWAWDSWKHAVALSEFAPELAKNQVRTMFDYQNDKGMIVDCIYLNEKENNWRNTKPPLAAWAVWKIYQKTGDKTFLAEMFPQLMKYHQWWYQYRDHDQDGLCEYGSTDGTVIAAKWESGMDNAVRFDNSKILSNNDNEWSIDQESVDLNAYLYAEKKFLSEMAKILGKNNIANKMSISAKKLKKTVQLSMFDDESGFFYDTDISSGKFLSTKGPEGWTPLFTELATREQAHKVVHAMCDTAEFATYYPFPTVSRKSPQFSTGYWRGTVWLDQACFGVMALREYGYDEKADTFTQQLFDRAEGLVNEDLPIRENYWSLDGKGMRANNFSWSAAHILMLLWEENFYN